jgi:hypothetical protein
MVLIEGFCVCSQKKKKKKPTTRRRILLMLGLMKDAYGLLGNIE